MKHAIPIWVTIIASLVTFSGLAFSLNLYFSPQTFFPATDFLAKDVKHFTDMWAMRQFVFAGFLAYALVLRQAQTLKLALILLIVLNMITIGDSLLSGDKKLIIESLVYVLLAAVMVAALIKRNSTKVPGSRKTTAIQAG